MWFYFTFCAANTPPTPQRDSLQVQVRLENCQSQNWGKKRMKSCCSWPLGWPLTSEEVQKHLILTSVRAFLTVLPCKPKKKHPENNTMGRICKDLLIPVNRYWKKQNKMLFILVFIRGTTGGKWATKFLHVWQNFPTAPQLNHTISILAWWRRHADAV